MTSANREFHVVHDAFIEIVRPSDPQSFGSGPLRIMGTHDGNRGVQWNVWMEWTDRQSTIAYLGVNLEGMKYGDWPIARLIQRELRDPWLLETRELVQNPNEVHVGLQRNAWQASGSVPGFREQYILPQSCVLGELTDIRWTQALIEARKCLASDEGGRARQTITLKDGRKVEREISPYLNFHRQLPSSSIGQDVQKSMSRAREQLQPLYDFVSDRSA